MLRTQISLTPEDRRLLDEVSNRTGRSVAALIRDAVNAVYGSAESKDEDLRAFDDACGARGEHRVDGETYVAGLRSGRRLDDIA